MEVITQRNIFGLKPAPSPVAAEAEPPGQTLAKVKLTGVMTFSWKRALLEVQLDGKTTFPILSEGESEGPVQVLTIDENNGSVRIVNRGMLATLTLGNVGNTGGATAVHKPLQSKPLANGPAHQSILRPRFVADPQ